VSTPAHQNRAEATYRFDLLRAPFYGILEAGWTTFALLIAIRYFEASESIKAFIVGAGPMGFLLTPLTLYYAAQLKARPTSACAFVFVVAAALLVGATLVQSLLLFAAFIITSQMAMVQQGTLMLQVYAENYAPHERGRRVTTPLMIAAFTSIAFSLIGGRLLDADLSYYKIIFSIMILAALASAWTLSKIPSQPLSTEHVGNPWQSFSLIWKDRFFGYLLGSWMLLGLGNLIAMPIRVEYLANPQYGINADNTTIAFLLLVVPSIARILSMKMWGHFFDKMHFVSMRNLLNVFFLISLPLFFFSRNIIALTLAMTCVGIAMGGGKIFWGLWVTKIAPPQKASSYMSIHMALTGFRGTLAPFIGYWILSRSEPAHVATVGTGLIAISIVLFELVRRHPRIAK
jgi:hypothetical protein